MAYRWRNGRLMSDQEVYYDDLGDWYILVYGGAAVIPTLVLAYLGYRLGDGNKYTMLVGAGAGVWFTHASYGILVKVWRTALCVGFALGMMAAFVYVLTVIWGTL
jgi:hypothetical protein